MSLGVAVGPLDTAVNIAFPAITAAFGIAITTIQWVVICYVLTYASLLLGCGRLGDVIGHKRVFLFGLGWSAISLYLCGWAPTFTWLLFFRLMQGVGTALLLSCAPALVTLAFPEAERGTALGTYTMLSALASFVALAIVAPLALIIVIRRFERDLRTLEAAASHLEDRNQPPPAKKYTCGYQPQYTGCVSSKGGDGA